MSIITEQLIPKHKVMIGLNLRISKKWIYIVLTTVFVAYVCLRTVQVAFDSRNTALILVYSLLVLFYLYAKGNIRHEYIQKLALCTVSIALMYQVLTTPKNTPFPFLSYLILLTVSFTPVMLFEALCQREDDYEQRITAILCAGMLAYLYINTLIEAQNNANIVHLITKINYTSSNEGILNVASFDSSYAVPSLVILLIALARTVSKWLQKLLCIASIALLLSVVVTAQYTSIFFLIAICILVLGIKRKNKTSVLIVMVLICVIPAIPVILDYFVQRTESVNVAARLSEVAAMMRYGDFSGYNLSARLGMYTQGIVAFLRSPLLGNRVLEVNPHSTFIQFAADIGLFGLLAYIMLLRMAKNMVKQRLTPEQYEVFSVCYLSLILTGMINPIINTYALSLVVFMFVPLVLKLCYHSTNTGRMIR